MFKIPSFRGLLSSPDEIAPEITLHQEQRALLVRTVVENSNGEQPANDHSNKANHRDQAQAFIKLAQRRLGLQDLSIDEDSLQKFDAFLDETSANYPASLIGSRNLISSWLGEVARRSHGLAWVGDVVTDGRVAFNPSTAVKARLSEARTSLTHAIQHAMAVSSIRSVV